MGCPHNHGCPALLTVRPKSAGNEEFTGSSLPLQKARTACLYRVQYRRVIIFGLVYSRADRPHLHGGSWKRHEQSMGVGVESGEPVII